MTTTNEPVLIPLKDCSEHELPCFAMLEIQGELIPPKEQVEPTNENLELGSLKFHDKIPTMIIGGHELKGIIEDLPNPFCVLKKTSNAYEITGIVKQKILFNQYPKALMR